MLSDLDEESDSKDGQGDDDYLMLDSEFSLPHLYMSSVEFCFNTQGTNLEIPYDMKIVQCILAMH
jgi:hypothetical protein